MTQTTRTTYTGENPFADRGVTLTLVRSTDARGTVSVGVEAELNGRVVARASHTAMLWDDVRAALRG